MNQKNLGTHPTWMELDFEALRANFLEVKRRVGADVKIMASIKKFKTIEQLARDKKYGEARTILSKFSGRYAAAIKLYKGYIDKAEKTGKWPAKKSAPARAPQAAPRGMGGKGGGRADMAQAGGKDPSKLDEALSKVREIVEKTD